MVAREKSEGTWKKSKLVKQLRTTKGGYLGYFYKRRHHLWCQGRLPGASRIIFEGKTNTKFATLLFIIISTEIIVTL